nr:glycosyl hydrolase [Pyrinomonadaceae bacterium]
EIISPDLTRNDKSKQGPSGGPITKDNTSVEYYNTIFATMESPWQKGVIWTGSDDGLVYVTRDGGKNWDNVTPSKNLMPEWIQINSIEASPNDPATAYVAATMYKWDDFKPYLYKTSDYGKTWKKITNGIPEHAFTRVIREDPNKRGMLYAGTETGLYMSFDDGAEWRAMQFNLPVVPITDLAVHKREQDLVAATQGRSFWIFDDLPVLHQMIETGKSAAPTTRLFKPEAAYRMQGGGGFPLPATATVGKNPPNGVAVYYSLKSKPASDVVLEFLDAGGKSIRKFTASAKPSPSPGQGSTTPEQSAGAEEGGPPGAEAPARLPIDVGLNRFIWDMRYPDAVRFPGMILWAGETRGPRIVPGSYQVKLTVDGAIMVENFEVKSDPRLAATSADYVKQLEFGLRIRDKVTEMHIAVIQIRDVRKQVEDLLKRVKDSGPSGGQPALGGGQPNFKVINDAATALNKSLTEIEETLYQTKNQSSQDPLNFPIRLNNKLATLSGVVARGDAAPTDQSYAVYDGLVSQIAAQLQRLARIMSTDVLAFNQLVKEQNVPAVVVKPPRSEGQQP